MENYPITVSECIALINQTLENAYPVVRVVGEVAEFRISQGKWVSFKLKDDEAIVDCFMSVYQLRVPIEDGMKISIVAAPRVNPKWGKFSLSIRTVTPVGEGSIKKGFDLLKAKLDAEGLFATERKRSLPRIPTRVAVITSIGSAAYADFCKIIDERWGGLQVLVANTQVQGEPAADQIIRALKYFNSGEQLPDVLVIIRGGGSAEDLMTFNDELLVREIAASRVPTLVGVGHEVDHTLADMVADKRAATPTNAAEILVPDKRALIQLARQQVDSIGQRVVYAIDQQLGAIKHQLMLSTRSIAQHIEASQQQLTTLRVAVRQLNPMTVLKQGYAIVRGEAVVGGTIEIETHMMYINAEVNNVRRK